MTRAHSAMEHLSEYPVLVAHSELSDGSAVGRAVSELASALAERQLRVELASSATDVEFAVSRDVGIGAALLDPELFADEAHLIDVLDSIHAHSDDIPVVMLVRRGQVEELPLPIAERTHGAFWLDEDTPAFVAGRVERLVGEYVAGLLSPFFGALKRYVDDYNWVWCCPGHNGGMTHKCLAGFSQASRIHVRDSHLVGQARRLEHDRFNEVFMMHASTSPQYNMIASLDVGAQIMRGRQGFVLMDGAVRESIALRKQVERYRDELVADAAAHTRARWFFDISGPHTVSVTPEQLEAALTAEELTPRTRTAIGRALAAGGVRGARWSELDDDLLASVPECWMFHEGDDWHDLTGLAPDYVMLDPTKCSITTPGIDRGRAFTDWGIPAAIPAAILRARGIVCEKTSFYTILLLATAAIERGKSAGVLSELLDIKRHYDRDALLSDVLPDLVAAHPQRYAGATLPELCDEMHEFLRERHADRLQRAAYNAEHEPEIVLRPADGHLALLRDGAELVPLDELAGRVAAALIVVYPPGIALMVPGERFAADSAAIAYLRLFEESDNRFPGFESETRGIFPRAGADGQIRYFTYAVPETAVAGA